MPAEGPPAGSEADRRARVLLSVLEDLRGERERLAHQTEQRRLAEQRFRATLEAAPAAMVMIDSAGRITLVNAQTEALFGYSREELLGAPVETLLPENLRPTHPALREAYFRSPRARAMGEGRDLFGRRKDGSHVPVEIGLSPVATDQGTFVLSTIIDITERKRLEDAQLRLNAELERRVAERTAELAVARDAAQAANRAKSDFLANMSHEIRTPLNAIVALSEVLSQSNLDARQREHVDIVLDSAESLLALISDVLDFSKVEAGKLDLEAVPFDLHELIDATLKALIPRATESSIELGLFVDPQLAPGRRGDPARLRQVLSNLLSNALKFTPEGEVEVRVRQDVEDPTRVRFEVRDTGVGIRQEEAARLFQPFEQADSSTTRRFGGTGLGLSISRQLVELMGGDIGLESEPGAGSAFHFGVPLARSGPGAAPPGELAGGEVLVASPSAMLRRNLEEMLSAWGLGVSHAATADAVLADLRSRAAQSAPPWLLLDAALEAPGLPERIRSEAGLVRPRLVLLPRLGEWPDPELCRRLEVHAVLARFATPQALLRALRGATGGEGSAGARESEIPLDRRLSGLRVLLAEDSGANRKVAEALLAEYVGRLDFVENGADALVALQDRAYDVVLMDVQMPDMDGLEATARIRSAEDPGMREVPIIAMTAHALQGDRERCLEAGMNDYVSKPVRREELFAAIANAVRSGTASGAEPTDQPRSRGKTGLVSRSS